MGGTRSFRNLGLKQHRLYSGTPVHLVWYCCRSYCRYPPRTAFRTFHPCIARDAYVQRTRNLLSMSRSESVCSWHFVHAVCARITCYCFGCSGMKMPSPPAGACLTVLLCSRLVITQCMAFTFYAGSVREVYTYYQDSSAITADCTAAFLQQLKQQLQANPSLAGSPSSSSKVAKDTQSFTKVSADVLNYLRYMKSSVLLDLLRKFCMAGGTQLDLSAVDPKQLQAELTRVLNPAALNSYFKAQSNRDGSRNDSASRNGMPRKVSEYGGYERPGGK